MSSMSEGGDTSGMCVSTQIAIASPSSGNHTFSN